MSAASAPRSLLLPDVPGLAERFQAAGVLELLSQEGAESAYAQAYYLTQQRQYLPASRLFALLSVFRPYELRVWQGLALCARELKAYDDAVRALKRYLELAPQAHEFSFAVADCLCLNGQRDQAIDWLESLAATARKQGAQDLFDRARHVIARLQGAAHAQPQH
ncbi:MAG: tetratricopeptide repeat protein [Xanthomonadales bacterium]|uniref:tetratricopeptide repeat protein n=1 Tax=Hydrogenophaga sp. TaxID=1904254 RepID=UPI0016AD45E5|nr:tetratricopeptide repeat protein [Hydrogenophaga sp.]NIQ36729.1 tetratricopeptide repeat protein [Xanthomonadales bacterium]NIM41997.1 tetratricopeptide repeat protein [Hydrogenophaga sp.]NIN27300.1 tetratricopeptide repeat protein [Hydrogenophaga sp.]NIN32001.1 tetratricopeptide repeat protein [Hydrogenophaga sp.]NIN56153.1 tetratricopeptide repeat protein [Hydrogenophaga sp.]